LELGFEKEADKKKQPAHNVLLEEKRKPILAFPLTFLKGITTVTTADGWAM
jgi:hypothetical protein